MRKLVLMVCFLVALWPTHAQTVTPTSPLSSVATATPEPYQAPRASVVATSAFLRAAPSDEAEAITSVFQGESLEVAGRSADGFWVWANRPYQPDGQAWIRRDLLTTGYDLTLVPLGENAFTTLLGEIPPVDTGFGANFIAEANLHREPSRNSPAVATVPILSVLPVVSRTPDGFWLKVNYLGIEGWVSEFLTQSGKNLKDVPLDPTYETDPRFAVTMPLIPREAQIAQVDRLLAWLRVQVVVAEDVAFYWSEMFNGKTMECLPPAPVPALYALTPQDIIELPELNQEILNITDAVEDINLSIAAMAKCGIYTADQLRPPLRASINARFIFNSVIQRMENLREILTGEAVR